ncbi:hypothetical protein ILYODFUR_009895 [Ilyodon furcidens]|uniref:Uncharacterized protein n=1 Tax=Ilyodon furcidens TaxID=33524 RepID=A0ABV0U425_9TELE
MSRTVLHGVSRSVSALHFSSAALRRAPSTASSPASAAQGAGPMGGDESFRVALWEVEFERIERMAAYLCKQSFKQQP